MEVIFFDFWIQALIELIASTLCLGRKVWTCELRHVQLFTSPWTVACQAHLSMGFPGENTGVGSLPGAGEAFRSWQRSWGRRLGIRKGGIEPQESARIFSSIFPPKIQSLPTLLLCALTSDFTGGCPLPPSRSLCRRVNLQLQLIKFLGN